jgi:hypothetical protein
MYVPSLLQHGGAFYNIGRTSAEIYRGEKQKCNMKEDRIACCFCGKMFLEFAFGQDDI